MLAILRQVPDPGLGRGDVKSVEQATTPMLAAAETCCCRLL